MITSKYRLTSSPYQRPDNQNKTKPKRVFFLSVEGDETESSYFEHLNSTLDNTILKIEVLKHKKGEGLSDPLYVLELLNEFLQFKNDKVIPTEVIQKLYDKFSQEDIEKDLTNLGQLITNQSVINDYLLTIGIDISYRTYLKNIYKEEDYFAIVIDRDKHSHSKSSLDYCYEFCRNNNIEFYITNPCFEFWLLLHLCDVKKEFSEDKLIQLLENPKVSNKHTFVSREVSNRANHSKTINKKTFEEYYANNITFAIDNAKSFKCQYNEILDNLGTTLPNFINLIKSESSS